VASPRLATLYATDDRKGFVRLLVTYEMIAVAVLVAGVGSAWAVGDAVVSLAFGSEYAGYPAALTWLALAAGLTFMGGFVGVSITIVRRLYIQVANSLVSLAVLWGSCAMLIPAHGLSGAACALTLGALSQLLLNTVICLNFLRTWKPSSGSVLNLVDQARCGSSGRHEARERKGPAPCVD
jgi:O-antigen/teichoic acid export membrane protein